jgi:hypothetical protein
MTLLLEVTEYGDAAHWRWRLTEEGGAFIADHQVALDASDVECQGFVDLHGFLCTAPSPIHRLTARRLPMPSRWARAATGPG